MSDIEIDEKTRAALGRLTEAEKECLRRRLRHQTAKEMALDLGISPHAVEKRLKMARAKLGLSSSLEAARLMETSDRYQQTAPQAADLALNTSGDEKWPLTAIIVGALVMSLLAASLILLAQQGVAPLNANGVAALDEGGVARIPRTVDRPPSRTGLNGQPIIFERLDPTESKESMVPPTPTEMHMIITNTFSVLDTDRSGFIEADETMIAEPGDPIERAIYRRDANGEVQPTGEVVRISRAKAQADYIEQADEDHDGRWSFIEYREWAKQNLARTGMPRAWREDTERTYGSVD